MAWLLVAVAAVALVWFVVLWRTRVVRLHRLHVRTDAARAGLEAALGRRAEVALTVASVLGLPQVAAAVAAARAVDLPGPEREAAENALGRLLATLDRSGLPADVRAALADAGQLVDLARRVHNDAVRDTLDLRSRRLVRWLHLAGTAPMPAYFEIADADEGVTTAAPGRLPDDRSGAPG